MKNWQFDNPIRIKEIPLQELRESWTGDPPDGGLEDYAKNHGQPLRFTGSPMNHWDQRFMEMAHKVATWSKDPSTKVGAYIAKGNVPISHGFNGFPRGTSDDPALYEDRARKYRRVLHAEQNALSFAQCNLDGCTIYITHAPCSRCVAQIIQSGITRVVCPNPWLDEDYISRWKEDVLETEAMCCEAGVKLEYINGT